MSVYSCPKCSTPLPSYFEAETPAEAARMCADLHDCPFVACDSETCRTLKNPITLSDWKAAAEHWRSHYLMHGCSHGR